MSDGVASSKCPCELDRVTAKFYPYFDERHIPMVLLAKRIMEHEHTNEGKVRHMDFEERYLLHLAPSKVRQKVLDDHYRLRKQIADGGHVDPQDWYDHGLWEQEHLLPENVNLTELPGGE